ncbi:MAG: hypothetical protein ACSLFN_07125 [Candidatus Limnocylindrales bacterium]
MVRIRSADVHGDRRSIGASTGGHDAAPAGVAKDGLEQISEALRQLAALQERIVPLELAMLADPELGAQRQQVLAASGGRPPGPPEAITAYLAAEQRLGRIRADVDPIEAAIVILAALFGLALTPGRLPVALDPDRVAAAVRLLVHGIAREASAD